MFSGIVEALGKIRQTKPLKRGVRLSIESELSFDDVKIGDSIAVNGICLTVVELNTRDFAVDVSAETLSCTCGLNQDDQVNLEKALRFSDRLGGHLVTGHVDGVGKIITLDPVGESKLLRIDGSVQLSKFIAAKGSVTVNGVSLTVNRVSGSIFEINLIPHTLSVTNLQYLKAGDSVNLEVDIIARYVARILSQETQNES